MDDLIKGAASAYVVVFRDGTHRFEPNALEAEIAAGADDYLVTIPLPQGRPGRDQMDGLIDPEDLPYMIERGREIAAEAKAQYAADEIYDYGPGDIVAVLAALALPPAVSAEDVARVIEPEAWRGVQIGADLKGIHAMRRAPLDASLTKARAILALFTPAPITAEDDFPFKEALHDLVQLRGEEFAIGGGPGFKERLAKAWRTAEELFEP